MSQPSRLGRTLSAILRPIWKLGERAPADQAAVDNCGFLIPPTVCSSTHADGTVLFHTGLDVVFCANRTGSRIWQGVARGDGLDTITFDLSREYEIPEPEARQAAVDFIRALRDRELVTPIR